MIIKLAFHEISQKLSFQGNKYIKRLFILTMDRRFI